MAAERSLQQVTDAFEERKRILIEKAFFGPSKQYVRWDTGLHELFEEAVNALGGAHAAKPAVIRDKMGIPLLTTSQVKSHLQKHRIRVVAEQGSKDATEAQARAAAKLLERQKRQGDGGTATARPRLLVPIRGSRQMSGGLGTGGDPSGDVGKRPKRHARKRRDYSDSFSSSGDEQGYSSYELQQWEAEELAAVAAGAYNDEGLQLAQRSQRPKRQRRSKGGSSSDFDSGLEETDGGWRLAGTTIASPLARGGGRRAVQQLEALPFVELVRALRRDGVRLDPAILTGLTQRRELATMTGATAPALIGPAQTVASGLSPFLGGNSTQFHESGGNEATTHHPLLPFLQTLNNSIGMMGGTSNGSNNLSTNGAVSVLNRQVQLEHALLEQSMWVQNLAAEVQELHKRQAVRLLPSTSRVTTEPSPFASMSQACFLSKAEPPPRNQQLPDMPSQQQQQQQQQQYQQQPSSVAGNLSASNSTLLRLLGSTLGGPGTLSQQQPPGTAAALPQGTSATGALTGEGSGGLATGQLEPGLAAFSAAASVAASDTNLVDLLSRSLCDVSQQQQRQQQQHQQPADTLTPSGNHVTTQVAAALTAAASLAQASPEPSLHTALAAAGTSAQSQIAAAAAQMLPCPPVLPSARPPPQPSLGGAWPHSKPDLQPGQPDTSNKETSLDVFNKGLLALGLAGAASAAAAQPQPMGLSTAEFLRLCSLPGASDRCQKGDA